MCYFNNAMCRPQASIDVISHTLGDPKFGAIDLIVGTGLSGLILLVPISLKSGIPFGAVRKSTGINHSSDSGDSHSSVNVETDYKHKVQRRVRRYVIIDDLIESGETIKRIVQTMEQSYPHSQCVGIILYQENDSNMHGDYPTSSISGDIFFVNDILKENMDV